MSGPTVWLASYPKSGNTWLRAVFTAWETAGPIDVNKLRGNPSAAERAPFDAAAGLASSTLTPEEVELLRPRIDEAVAADARGPLLRKIHDGLYPGPEGEPILSVPATRAAVYVVRDPRDVAVSYAHHAGETPEWACAHLGDPAAAMSAGHDRLHRQLRQRLGTWSQHVRSWIDDAPFPVEVVRYEDCAERPMETFTRVLRFVGYGGLDEARVADAVERAAFVRLRAAEERQGFQERTPESGHFFRRGEAGSWREELSAELSARIEREHGETMARFGYQAAT